MISDCRSLPYPNSVLFHILRSFDRSASLEDWLNFFFLLLLLSPSHIPCTIILSKFLLSFGFSHRLKFCSRLFSRRRRLRCWKRNRDLKFHSLFSLLPIAKKILKNVSRVVLCRNKIFMIFFSLSYSQNLECAASELQANDLDDAADAVQIDPKNSTQNFLYSFLVNLSLVVRTIVIEHQLFRRELSWNLYIKWKTINLETQPTHGREREFRRRLTQEQHEMNQKKESTDQPKWFTHLRHVEQSSSQL